MTAAKADMRFGFQIDVARRLERPQVLFDAVAGIGECGYDMCALYLEDAYDYPGHPAIGRPHAYGVETMRELAARCARQGIELIPVIPSLGHCGWITRKPPYARLDEGHAEEKCFGTVRVDLEETYELLESLYRGWCDHITGRYLHVGLDESPYIGYQAAQRGLARAEWELFADHCRRLQEIAGRLGRTMIMWGDMLCYFPEALDRLPKGIVVADWYYYSFPTAPRVELFNFTDTDLSGALRARGVEVWGVPSVWPNMPFPDVGDRFENLASWLRYGGERGIAGILNTDWENSSGFYESSDLLFRCFGRMVDAGAGASGLAATLVSVLGLPDGDGRAASFAADILDLGEHHLTGHQRRNVLARGALAFLTPHAPRREEAARRAARLDGMFAGAESLLSAVTGGRERRMLESILLAHRLLTLYWRLEARASDWLDRHAAGGPAFEAAADEMRRLVTELDEFQHAYRAFWNGSRYEDDPSPMLAWAAATREALASWILPAGKDGAGHPFDTVPRLEMIIECERPALPVLRVRKVWAGGRNQDDCEIMIRFESAYACPRNPWRAYPTEPLAHGGFPDRIECENSHYGRIVVRDVAVVLGSTRLAYHPAERDGMVVPVNGGVAIGPVSAAAGDPPRRGATDRVVFRPAAERGQEPRLPV